MAFRDVAGIFSRYFIVGFFLPAFFGAIIVAHLVSNAAFPEVYAHASGGARLLILGGTGLFVGLLLSGLHFPVIRLYEGYPLENLAEAPVLGRLHSALVNRWEKKFDALDAVRSAPEPSRARTEAARELSAMFPPRDQLLPTRFGNVIRCFERHPRSRYGLDGVVMWPRVAMLLSQQEQDMVTEGLTDVAFFINASVVSVIVGSLLIADGVWHGGVPIYLVWSYSLPFFLAWVSYRSSIGPAVRWGESVRAAIDLHRAELCLKIGVQAFRTVEDERRAGEALNRLFQYGEPIPDDLRAQGAEG